MAVYNKSSSASANEQTQFDTLPSTPPDEEKDSDDASLARAQPTPDLLLPPGWSDAFMDRFSLIVSKAAFDGYAQQPRAVNAALSEPAGGSGALTHLEVSALLHAMLSEQMAKRQASVLRLLRIPSLGPAIEALQAGLAAEGRALGGRKEKGCTAKEGLARLRALCAREMGKKNGQVEDDEEGLMWLALSHELKLLLGKLAGCEQLKPSQPRLLTTHVGNWGIRGAVRALREGHFDGSDPRLSTLIARQQQEEGRRKLLLQQDSGLSDEISLSLPAIDGSVAEPPSLSSLTVSTLASLRVSGMPTPMLTIRKSDGNTEVEACWVGLKAAFAKEASALIIHHKNHYSLIFAMLGKRSIVP
ncbi:MAG: hypothetical protein SGPRY_001641 [Prymnesium sp.]